MRRFLGSAASLAFCLAAIGLWQLIADARLVNPLWLPGPDRAFAKLWEWARSGVLWAPLGMTVWRMLAGWLAACAVGIALGAAIASSPLARDLFQPSAEFLRPLPASAVLGARGDGERLGSTKDLV